MYRYIETVVVSVLFVLCIKENKKSRKQTKAIGELCKGP